jgi:hypothetical protein
VNISPNAIHHTLGTGADEAAAGTHTHVAMAIRSFEGTLMTGTGTLRIYNCLGRTVTISKVMLCVATAPTGAAIVVDVHLDGITLFTNQANRPQIVEAANTGQSTTIENNSWADGHYLTVDIDQIGSIVAGSDMTVHIIYL